MFKWNYEQHLYTHTLIPIINRFASTNEPLKLVFLDMNTVVIDLILLISMFMTHVYAPGMEFRGI